MNRSTYEVFTREIQPQLWGHSHIIPETIKLIALEIFTNGSSCYDQLFVLETRQKLIDLREYGVLTWGN